MAIPGASARAVAERLRALGVREEDLRESFVRAGGKGGQNVNKVATCVVLVHDPSGTAVKCQQARTQGENRLLARALLADKIEANRLERAQARTQEIARAERQRRRRPRGVKLRMLADKRARSETKAGRGRLRDHD
jgi:peptide chain release factor